MSKKKVSAFSVYQKKKRDGEEKEEGELDVRVGLLDTRADRLLRAAFSVCRAVAL